MAEDVLKHCKKFVIQRIVNPAVYWMTEYDIGGSFRSELKRFESLLEKDVERFNDTDKILIGNTVAVRDETGFHRGLVTDVFNRSAKITYLISLIDYGKVIETNQKKLFSIKSKELKIKKPNIIEVSLQNIQPVALVLGCEQNNFSGIFQKRKCNNWSSTALKFVKNLFENDTCVFVKSLDSKKGKISGEIYFVQKPKGMLVSLGQKLCDEGFAIIYDNSPKVIIKNDLKGIGDVDIVEKIPGNALFTEVQNSVNSETFGQNNEVGISGNKTFNKKKSAHETNDLPQPVFSKKDEAQSDSSSCSSANTICENKSFKSNLNPSAKSSENIYSSSCMLKKCQINSLTTLSSSDTFKKQSICEGKQNNNTSPESPKVSLFRIVERNIKLFNEQKEKPERWHN